MNLNNKVILVTGGTGSFGRAFTRQVLTQYKPKKVIIFSRDEMKQYEMNKEFNIYKDAIRYFIGDVRDSNRLHRAFQGVDVIVHAAALKIVPSLEYNPFEAVQTNVIGAENIINMAIDNKVQKVVALSTDKAANPVNLYGATKLCSEKMFVAGNKYSPKGTRFSVVRYGNVFGSRGSVVPFFKECLKTGVVPITHPEMTRFWITLKQGVNFVLEALSEMKGGEIFIPKLPSIKITDLAEAVAPGCKKKIIGIRAGEKLHETLVSPDDGVSTYEFKTKYVTFSQIIAERKKMPNAKALGVDFPGYRSDINNQWLSVSDLKKITKSDY